MKKLINFFVGTAMLSTMAFADVAPRIEPGPVLPFSKEKNELARFFLNRDLKDCIAEIHSTPYEFSFQKGTFQNLEPGTVKYVLSGMLLRGGDMAMGRADMTILQKTTTNEFGQPTPYYECKAVLETL